MYLTHSARKSLALYCFHQKDKPVSTHTHTYMASHRYTVAPNPESKRQRKRVAKIARKAAAKAAAKAARADAKANIAPETTY